MDSARVDRKIEASVDVVRPLTFRLTLAQLVAFVVVVASGAFFTQRVTDGQNHVREEVAAMRRDVHELTNAYNALATSLEVLRAQQSGTQRQVDDLSGHVNALARRVDEQSQEFDRLSNLLARSSFKARPR